jgi:hypothetical protein
MRCDTGHPELNSLPLLKIHAATVVKNGKKVLDNLAFEVQEGEHTAILGLTDIPEARPRIRLAILQVLGLDFRLSPHSREFPAGKRQPAYSRTV